MTLKASLKNLNCYWIIIHNTPEFGSPEVSTQPNLHRSPWMDIMHWPVSYKMQNPICAVLQIESTNTDRKDKCTGELSVYIWPTSALCKCRAIRVAVKNIIDHKMNATFRSHHQMLIDRQSGTDGISWVQWCIYIKKCIHERWRVPMNLE